MVIVASYSPQTGNWQKPLMAFIFVAGFILTLIPVVSAVASQVGPTGSYLSPLPENQLAEASPSPTQTELTASGAILSAQAFLEKAINLAKNPEQTEADQAQIVALLNQSLTLANQAVALAPTSPQSYLMRARILSSSATLRPDATLLAQKDLEAAQALANGQTITLPTEIDLLELAPKQRAEGEANLIIAAPEVANTKESTASASSNTQKLTAIIPAGKTEITVKNSQITTESYIYLIPADSSQTIYLKTKTDGQAVVATDSPLGSDLAFEYWIVTP